LKTGAKISLFLIPAKENMEKIREKSLLLDGFSLKQFGSYMIFA